MLRPQKVSMQNCGSCYFLGASTTLYKQVCIVISMYLCFIGTIKTPSPRTTKKKREEGPSDRRRLVALGRKLGNAFHQAMLSLVGVYQETFLILIGWLDTTYNSRIK